MRLRRPLLGLILVAAACQVLGLQISAQTQTPPKSSDEVVRVNTDLIQTDVMVFDRQGNFVDGLKRDQFVLKVDGKVRDLQFFDRISAGSRNEDAQLAAARGAATGLSANGIRPIPLDRGRTVFFFIDDFHLSLHSVSSTRRMLSRYVDREMGQNDEVAIVSAAGQIGFLQQLSGDKAMLHAAIERLKSRPYDVRDIENPRMSEYQAMLILRNDDDVLNFYVDALVREDRQLPRGNAADMVRARATQIVSQAGSITTQTLLAIRNVIDRSKALAGRKVLFMISDGFYLDSRNSDTYDRLRRATSAAAASGMVIYSIDARGLGDEETSVTGDVAVDVTGRLQRASAGERGASEDGLNALAADTGGRAFYNNNSVADSVTKALKESSVYYLLAWRPETDEQRNQKFRRIEVSVNGRSDLVVRTRSGFGATETAEVPASRKDKQPAKDSKPVDQLRLALLSAFPKSSLPVSLSVNFINLPQRGSVLATSFKIRTNQMVFEQAAGGPSASIDLTGVVLDENGRSVDSFSERITMKPRPGTTASPPEGILFNHFSQVVPGLYQVRVAAKDNQQQQVGSVWRWIVIPDLSKRALTLSSLIVGERNAGSEESANTAAADNTGPLAQVSLNVDHRFQKTSRMRFLTFVYNATGTAASIAPDAATGPASSSERATPARDLAVQVQIFRDNEPVLTDPLHRINTQGVDDLTRIPFAAELSLDSLQPGMYFLQVTVIDRLAKASASQRFSFQVE
jgi:VWFA-related protein